METVFQRCGGLDVHSKSVQASVRLMDSHGRTREESRSFGTVTRDLLALRDCSKRRT
jgi:hypothetical protein